MAFKIPARTGEYTATTGTGTVTTAGAGMQMQTFAAGVGNANTCPYFILSGDGINWERGIGTVTVSGSTTTIARTTVVESTNSNTAISLAGNSFIMVSPPGDIAGVNGLLDEVFGSTQGTILYRDSASWLGLAPGTNGFVLTTQGGSANPKWAAAAGGGGGGGGGSWTLINTVTASNAADMEFTNLPAGFDTFVLVLHNVYPQTNGDSILIQIGEGGTPTWKTTGYSSSSSGLNSTGGSNGPTNSTSGIITSPLGVSSTLANGGISATIWCANITNAAQRQFHGTSAASYSATPTTFSGNNFIGTYNADTTAATALRVIATTGNINGKATLYGVQETASSGGGALFARTMSSTIPTSANTGYTTWDNQGSATITDGASGVSLAISSGNGSAHVLHSRKKAAPTAPYTLTFLMACTTFQNYFCPFFGWTDGTKFDGLLIQNDSVFHSTWTNNTTQSTQTNLSWVNPNLGIPYLWVRLIRDGSNNVTLSCSRDGDNYFAISGLSAQATSGGFLGTSGYSNVCFGIDNYSQPGALNIQSYAETSP